MFDVDYSDCNDCISGFNVPKEVLEYTSINSANNLVHSRLATNLEYCFFHGSENPYLKVLDTYKNAQVMSPVEANNEGRNKKKYVKVPLRALQEQLLYNKKHAADYVAPFTYPEKDGTRNSSTFDPKECGLSEDFDLTDYCRLKGCSCKVPKMQLVQMLNASTSGNSLAPRVAESSHVGMDSSTTFLKNRVLRGLSGKGKNGITSASGTDTQLFLLSTTDFFSPNVEDPHLQGIIAAANVLSDVYATGCTVVDDMLMLLATCTEMDNTPHIIENEVNKNLKSAYVNSDRWNSTVLMMRGFKEKCASAGIDDLEEDMEVVDSDSQNKLSQQGSKGVSVRGGQSVQNPWPLIGGVAMAVVTAEQMIPPPYFYVENKQLYHKSLSTQQGIVPGRVKVMQPGNCVVLTKPLGTQVAVNLRQWLKRKSSSYIQRIANGKFKPHMSIEEIEHCYKYAVTRVMSRLNYYGAKYMHKNDVAAIACTDVTGFGLRGHAENLIEEANRAYKSGWYYDESESVDSTAYTASVSRDTRISMRLHTIPVLQGAIKASLLILDEYKLISELVSAETSGGLLVVLPNLECAKRYCNYLEERENEPAWIVGEIISQEKEQEKVILTDDAVVVMV